jgi:hypothetical protein
LVWHHQLFSFDSAIRPGWAIDDVCVSVTNIPPGRLTISNNLAQARVSLGGPTTHSGQGYWIDFTNLPPGRYVVTWQSIPYYTTPQPQSIDLVTDGLIELTGNYTFPDTNGNGISDMWEQQFFGGLHPVRTCQTDADGDGFSDCSEFIAGTNPTNANSLLRLSLPVVETVGPNAGKLRFQWPVLPGRIYQLQGLSRDFQEWNAQLSPWLRATTGTLTWHHSVPDQGEPYVFRVEVRP